MPTPLDRALHNKGAFFAFTGLVTAVAAWTIYGGDIFPSEADPKGDPSNWTREQLRHWLERRNLHPDKKATREELLERVRANLK